MANNLGRNIEKGEEVIVSDEYLKVEVDPVFICESGFGMSAFTSGRAVFGKWKATGEEDRIEGWMIDEVATRRYHEKQQTIN